MKPSQKIKVLVVDDSFFMRKLLREVLDKDPRIRIVGTAKNGVEAVAEALRLKPDVITMDFNMPRMNGAQATEEIMKNASGSLPAVIMLSAYTREGAEETLSSLRAGAIDFIPKPSGELSLDIDKITDELIRKIYIASRAVVHRYPRPSSSNKEKQRSLTEAAERIVVIGASTGGPPLVEDILMELPINFPAAVLVVQHMPEYFVKKFSKRLDKLTPFVIKEAAEGEILDVGDVLIAPGNRYVNIHRDKKSNRSEIKLLSRQKNSKALTSIDQAMISAAKVFGKKTIGVILSGMGEDGLLGMAAIKESGGYAMAQDPVTAVVNSMPNSVIEAGLVKEVLTPAGISQRIIELCTKNNGPV